MHPPRPPFFSVMSTLSREGAQHVEARPRSCHVSKKWLIGKNVRRDTVLSDLSARWRWCEGSKWVGTPVTCLFLCWLLVCLFLVGVPTGAPWFVERRAVL